MVARKTVIMPEILKQSESNEDLGSEGNSPRSSANPSPTMDLITKHPLQNQWTLWYYKCDRSKNWEDNQRIVSQKNLNHVILYIISSFVNPSSPF